MTPPRDHVPATPRQAHIMRTDAQLSALIEQAVKDQDFDLVVDAMAEKLDLERALGDSRRDSWHAWHIEQTGDAA